MKAICGLMIHTAPLLDAQPALQLGSSLSFQTLCALPPQNRRIPGLPGCHNHHVSGLSHWPLWPHTIPESHGLFPARPKGRSNFCSVVRLQWFTLITKSSTKTEGLDLNVYFQHTIKERARFTHINEDPIVVELVSKALPLL